MSSPTNMTAPLTPPQKPLLPRSQPPRPQPQPTPQSHSQSSPAVTSHHSRATTAPPALRRPPSAPDAASAYLLSSEGLTTGSSSQSTAGAGSVPTAISVSSFSSYDSSNRHPLVTPSSSSTTFPLGPPIGLAIGGHINNAKFDSVSGSASGSGSGFGGPASEAARHPLQRMAAGGSGAGASTASSTTSVHGLLSSSSAQIQGLPPSSTAGQLHTPSTHPNNNASQQATASVGHTPQTGASKMAAAAKRGLDGVPTASAVGLAKMVEEEEGHPLSEKSLRARDYQTIHTLNRLFHLPSRWRLIRPLGQGAYGLVINVQDSYSGEPVAVKCITRVFDKVILARRALREITLLRHFGGHENLTGLIDLDNVWEGYNEIYLYMEPMEADLHQIVRSAQSLSNSHIQYFLYQLLRGMKYIHTANVIHRDLKPGNLLVNSDCELKICDFGLARGFKPVTGEEGQNDELKLTEYVATRWYRAPEVMLSNRRYTTAIDVWSIGCILAELLGGKPIFKGKDYVDQVNLILGVLGTPDDETLMRVGSEKANAYIKSLPFMEKQEFSTLFPNADPDAIDLLSQLLAFDPSQRIDVVTALSHPYLASYHDPTDEPACPEVFSKWEQVESLTTIEELREAITREIEEFREEVRTMDEEDYLDDDEEIGEWGIDGAGQDGQAMLHASPMPDSGMLEREGVPIPPVPQEGSPYAQSLGISPKAAFSPMAKRASLLASPDQRKSVLASPRVGTHQHSQSAHFPAPGPRSAAAGGSGLRTRDASPSTPATALSEESFGNPFSASGGRSSRRQSGHSMTFSMSGRRPNSFLFNPFGAGMTPMPTQNPGGGGSAAAVVTGSAPPGAAGTGSASIPSTNGELPVEGAMQRERTGSSHWGGRRSRAPSQSGMGLLIRQLSVVDFEGKGDHRPQELQEVPPMTVSPSDAPPSEVPKGFS
ncbi:CMGC/MAPK protein kinase [Kwoniella heveanensis CBS 569]|nr:CMGC/MAPK protein kinase [Kwoniella heveanensis CBS 569]